jgi:hypothetical protein
VVLKDIHVGKIWCLKVLAVRVMKFSINRISERIMVLKEL